MYCTISPSSDHSHIVIKYNGDLNHKMVIAPIIESHALGRRLNIRRYLVDVTDTKNAESVLESYQYAYQDKRIINDIDRSVAIVVVIRPGRESYNFVASLSEPSRLSIKLFQDMSVALEHLLDQEPAGSHKTNRPLPPDGM